MDVDKELAIVLRELGSVLSKLVISIAMDVVIIIFMAWITSVIWGWLLVPAGYSAMPISVLAGIILIIRLVTYRAPPKNASNHTLATMAAIYTVLPLLILCVAWLIKGILL